MLGSSMATRPGGENAGQQCPWHTMILGGFAWTQMVGGVVRLQNVRFASVDAPFSGTGPLRSWSLLRYVQNGLAFFDAGSTGRAIPVL